MLTGVYAARNVLGEHYDVWSVNIDQEYHEEVREGARNTDLARGPGRALTRAGTATDAEDREFKELLAAAFARIDALALGLAMAVVCGLGLFLSSAVLLLKGGAVVGPTLSLLTHYLFGYGMTWTGALIGALEVALGAFFVGYVGARLRNGFIGAYIHLLARAASARQQRDLLGRI